MILLLKEIQVCTPAVSHHRLEIGTSKTICSQCEDYLLDDDLWNTNDNNHSVT